jgi:hypothetical protein
MRQWLRSHVTFANVVSVTALFVALGGTAIASVIITDNSQVAANTISGHKPPSGKHANLFAGSVNAQDVAANSLTGASINETTLTGDSQNLIYTASASSSSGTVPITPIATVGPYTIEGQCENNSSTNNRIVRIYVKGPSGTADSLWSQTQNDSTDLGTHSTGLLIPANTNLKAVEVSTGPGDFSRAGGTSMLRAGSVLVQVDFNAVADGRGVPGSCFIYGTATRAT